jgi:hypothetical protein
MMVGIIPHLGNNAGRKPCANKTSASGCCAWLNGGWLFWLVQRLPPRHQMSNLRLTTARIYGRTANRQEDQYRTLYRT